MKSVTGHSWLGGNRDREVGDRTLVVGRKSLSFLIASDTPVGGTAEHTACIAIGIPLEPYLHDVEAPN